MDPPSTNNENYKSKVVWDINIIEQFIQACLDQVHKGEHNGTTFTKKGWKAVIAQFSSLSGRNYNKTQFKNK